MPEENKAEYYDLDLRKIAKLLKDVVRQHTGVNTKVGKSIVYTFIEAMTHGHSAMISDPELGSINAMVYLEPDDEEEIKEVI